MSMHKKPLTVWEREGLNSHHLPVDTPSQLSDVFRQGMAWGQKQSQAEYDALVITANTQSEKLSKIRIYCQGNNIGNWGDSSTDALINHCNALTAQLALIQEIWVEAKFSIMCKPLDEIRKAIESSPQQALAEIRAEAIDELINNSCAYEAYDPFSYTNKPAIFIDHIKEHAEQIRQGGE